MRDVSRKKSSKDENLEGDLGKKTLSDLLLGLEHLGLSFKVVKKEDKKYHLVEKLTSEQASKVFSCYEEEIRTFIECLSERTYNTFTIDQDIIQYHLSIHLDIIGQDIYEELCSESKNINYFYNYVLFMDFILKKKRSKKFKEIREAILDSYQNASKEIYMLKRYVIGIQSFFEE